jgi:hypothetical protein
MNTSSTIHPTVERVTRTLESSVGELVSLGKLWAGHGLTVGASTLAASAKSLEATSRMLSSLKEDLAADGVDGVDGEASAEAGVTPSVDGSIDDSTSAADAPASPEGVEAVSDLETRDLV